MPFLTPESRLKVLDNAVRQEGEIRGTATGRGKNTPFLGAEDKMINLENTSKSKQKHTSKEQEIVTKRQVIKPHVAMRADPCSGETGCFLSHN